MFRVIFFGTSDFAVPSLSALCTDSRFDVVGIVTQPDRPVGRHAHITPPPVKQFFLEQTTPPLLPTSLTPSASQREESQTKGNIVFQPEKLTETDFRTWIEEVGPSCDAFVVIAYGKILPSWLIKLPKKGIINVHGSLLPRWRGAAPIQAAIAAGDNESGVTVMLIDDKLDHGPILGIQAMPIRPSDTGQDLHDRLAQLGKNLLPDILAGYLESHIQPREQEHDLATTCHTLTRDDGKLDFQKTAAELERQIRAYTPWPGNWMEYQGKRLKIHQVRLGISSEHRPGEIFQHQGSVFLACAKGTSLELQQVQLEGKKIQIATQALL